MLFLFKYSGFAVRVASLLFQKIHIQLALPAFDFLLPAGISFYTFQALGYAIDVYRGDIYAEKNFVRYALFVSFFPQLVAGPIERSKNLLKQLAAPVKFQPEAAWDLYDSFQNTQVTVPDFPDSGFFVFVKIKAEQIAFFCMISMQVFCKLADAALLVLISAPYF